MAKRIYTLEVSRPGGEQSMRLAYTNWTRRDEARTALRQAGFVVESDAPTVQADAEPLDAVQSARVLLD